MRKMRPEAAIRSKLRKTALRFDSPRPDGGTASQDGDLEALRGGGRLRGQCGGSPHATNSDVGVEVSLLKVFDVLLGEIAAICQQSLWRLLADSKHPLEHDATIGVREVALCGRLRLAVRLACHLMQRQLLP